MFHFQLIQYPDLVRPCLAVAGHISGNIVDTRETMEFCASKNLKPIQTIVLADQLDDVFEVLANPATTIARYTLDCKKSFSKLMEDEGGEVVIEKSEESENDAPDFEDVVDAGDDEGLGEEGEAAPAEASPPPASAGGGQGSAEEEEPQ